MNLGWKNSKRWLTLTDIILIADFFYKDFTGGAELNDYSLIERFKHTGIFVKEIYCKQVTIQFLEKNKKCKYIVANFVTLSEAAKEYMMENIDYVIYEHDHKYLKRRNPIFYKDFLAPKEDLSNLRFYKNAKKTICLTQLALDVFKANTGLENCVKLGASVWRKEDLQFLSNLSGVEKNDKYAIMDSDNPIKKKQRCIEYCNRNQISFDLISDKQHQRFIQKLSPYKGLVFMTGHLETCCRIVVEAKMLNCKVTTQTKLIGAASEPWFDLNGLELIEKIEEISENSVNIFSRELGI